MGRKITKERKIAPKTNAEGVAISVRNSYPECIVDGKMDVLSLSKTIDDIDVEFRSMDKGFSGSIKKNDSGHFLIIVNELQHPYRQRFTLAHELGHYFLHSHQLSGEHVDVVLFRDDNTDSLGIEYAANEFAAALLMPKDEFIKAIQQGTNTFDTLSDFFQVTPKAAMYRAYKLGIIPRFYNS